MGIILKRAANSTGQGRSGSIMLVSLWALFFLSVLVIAVSVYVSSGMQWARDVRGKAVSLNCAHAGVNMAIALVLADTNGWDDDTELWSKKDFLGEVRMEGGYFSVYHLERSLNGTVTTNYGLGDEDGKIDINKANRSLLESAFVNIGKVDAARASEIAASIIDWRDEDQDILTGGAESGYYQAKGLDFGCRDGKFQNLSELLLVRGMDENIFREVSPHLTVWSGGKININTAGEPVLDALFSGVAKEASSLMAAKIRASVSGGEGYGKVGQFSFLSDLTKRANLTADEQGRVGAVLKHLTLKSDYVSGIVRGVADGDGGVSEIYFVFDRVNRKTVSWAER